MTDTLLVRLKPYDPRRGHVLRRYTYAGIKFQEERGWYRVERPVAEYLRAVREVPTDRYAPPAFDVCADGRGGTGTFIELKDGRVALLGARGEITRSPRPELLLRVDNGLEQTVLFSAADFVDIASAREPRAGASRQWAARSRAGR
jgi:hypothetical protein